MEIDDTTRSYVFWDGSTRQLNPSYVDVRFAPGVTDSAALAIADRYGLKPRTKAIFGGIRFYVFCVPEGKRAEEFFTPYGKPHIQNFGTEPLVDAAFAVFENGLFSYTDEFIVEFDSTVTRAAIDSINALYSVIIDTTFVVADRLWHMLRVTKQSPYSSFDMANLYHCLKEIRDSTSHANVYAYNPPLGETCTLASYLGGRLPSNAPNLTVRMYQFTERRKEP